MRILSFLTAAALLPGLAGDLSAGTSTRVTSRTYDPLDRLESETVALESGATATVSYTYYNDGRRRTVTDAYGRVTFYEYDGRGNLARVTANQGLPDEHATSFEYWPDELLRTITRPNGVVTSYGYDRADRLISIVVRLGPSELASYAYTYDANGNRLTQVETNGGSPETTSYTYDSLKRLSTVAYPDGISASYEYDAVGNRTREIVRNGSTVVSDKTAVFDPINRLTSITDAVDPSGSATLGWDDNGNLLSKTTPAGVESYTYDAADHLVETSLGPSITSRFAFDPFGRRVIKLGLEGVRQYVYDETSTLHEADEAGLEVATYAYGEDRLLSFVRHNEPRRFYDVDALGSPVVLSDSSGSVIARYHLDAWGRYRTPSELSASANRFGFTGYLFDQETSLYYAKARFYDSEIGRFTSQDSVLGQVDEPPSLNRYFYGNANPLRFVDPTGHGACPAFIPCEAIVEQVSKPAAKILKFTPKTPSQPAAPGVAGPLLVAQVGAAAIAGTDAAATGTDAAIEEFETATDRQLRAQNRHALILRANQPRTVQEFRSETAPAPVVPIVKNPGESESEARRRAELIAQGVPFVFLDPVASPAVSDDSGGTPPVDQPPTPLLPLPPSDPATGPSRVFYGTPRGDLILGSSELPLNSEGGRVVMPVGHVLSPLDPPLGALPIVRRGPFTSAQRAAFLRGSPGDSRLAPHHRGQLPVQHGGVIDELPGPGNPGGNVHTGQPRHPNPSIFNRMQGGGSLRSAETKGAWIEKGGRLVEVSPGVWIDPAGK